jgi:hypothetical protein
MATRRLKSIVMAIMMLGLLFPQLAAAQAAWPTYSNEAFGYHISYPPDWEFKPPNEKDTFFVTSRLNGDGDRFRENVNCKPLRLQIKDFNIRSAEAQIIAGVSTMPDFKLIKSTYVRWNGVEALMLEYTLSNTTNGERYDIHIQQQMSVIGDVLYAITFTSEEGSYARYLPMATQIVNSMKVN